MANTIHGVVRTDRMAGTDVRSELISAKYFVGTKETEIDNGCVVDVSAGLLEGEREIYKAVDATATTKIDDLVLVATPEVMYDERLKNFEDFYNEAGQAIRCYHLVHADIFSVTDTVLSGSGTPAVGDKITIAAGNKLAFGGSGTAIGKIIAVDKLMSRTFYVIQID